MEAKLMGTLQKAMDQARAGSDPVFLEQRLEILLQVGLTEDHTLVMKARALISDLRGTGVRHHSAATKVQRHVRGSQARTQAKQAKAKREAARRAEVAEARARVPKRLLVDEEGEEEVAGGKV